MGASAQPLDAASEAVLAAGRGEELDASTYPNDASTSQTLGAERPSIAPRADMPDAVPPDVHTQTDAGAQQLDAPYDAQQEVMAVASVDVDASVEPAPVVIPATVAETRPAPIPEAKRTRLAVTTIIGLLALLTLAYVSNHPRARRIEDALGLRSAITAGFPFVALGLIARHPAVGVLDDAILVGMTPIIELGLGWLGFVVGLQLNVASLERIPRSTLMGVALSTALPLAMIALACSAAFIAMGFAWTDPLFLRSGVVLGTAGAMTAPLALHNASRRLHGTPGVHHLDELAGVVGLAIIAAYFRPSDLAQQWALPGTAWLFVTLGMGVTLGALLYVTLRRPANEAEFIAITIGSVAFAAGMAAYVRLSPLVICFVAGAVIANLSSTQQQALRQTLERLERPISLVFLMLAGALWDPRDWRGWALVPVFVISRYLGIWLGQQLLAAGRERDAAETVGRRSPLIAPLSVIAIAVVVNVRILYHGPAVPLMITAVIGGALVAEVASALAERSARREREAV
jgi:Kef-type K+ transport system membrane component KefB